MTTASESDTTQQNPARLIRDHQQGVWRYLRALGCDTALADDITQDTFLALLQGDFQYESAAATSAYLRTVAHNLFVSHLRREKKRIQVDQIEQLAAQWTRWASHDGGEDLLGALRLCLDALSDRARLALQMRFRERHSRAEIAARLEITEHGAKNLMQRAKKQLRCCIEGKLS